MEFLEALNIDFTHIKNYLMTIGISIIVTYLILFIVRFTVKQFFKKTRFIEEKKAQTIESVIKNTGSYVAFFIILIVSLKPFVDIEKLLVAGGVLGIVIGFGAQSAIKDVLYGFFFLFESQFRKGDFVQINESPDGGVVEELGFRAVKIRLLSGKLLTISNGEILKVINGNVDKRRVFESIIVSFREDPSKIKKLLQEVCDELNEKHAEYLMIDKDTDEKIEEYHVYGLSSLDVSPLGYRFSIAATTKDTHYIVAVQEVKEVLAQKLFDSDIKMPEQSVFYQTRANLNKKA